MTGYKTPPLVRHLPRSLEAFAAQLSDGDTAQHNLFGRDYSKKKRNQKNRAKMRRRGNQ